MKNVRISVLIVFMLVTAYLSVNVFHKEQKRKELKEDLIELSKIKYGMFNVDEWKIALAEIITKKVEELDLDEANKQEMRTKISNFLSATINDLENRYYEEKSSSVVGKFQSGVAKLTGTFEKIKKDIPTFTEQIIEFLSDDENRMAIRGYMIQKLNEYADGTFSETDYKPVEVILHRYNYKDIRQCQNHLQQAIVLNRQSSKASKISLVIIACLFLGFIAFFNGVTATELLLGILFSFGFLLMGVLLPMIEIDARISNITFSLLGEKIEFTDQVLYYKSKSMLRVVHLMLTQHQLDVLLVGVLVLTFSVLFPIAKLICSGIYLLKPSVRKRKLIGFLVFKSGKWSMADVMVIAILMTYIGFEGIISEQLNQLESLSSNIDLLTTNKSHLLFGFFSFTIFVLFSLSIAQKIQTKFKVI